MYYILYIPYLRVIYIIYERSYEIYKRLCFFKRVVVCIHHIFFTPQRNYFYTSIQESSGGIPLSDEDDSSDVVTSSVDGGSTITGNDLALF